MYYCVAILFVSVVYSQQTQTERKNSTVEPQLNSQRSARQYGVPQVEQFRPTGYPYPTSQRLEFSHDNKLHIYFFQNKLSIYCATDTTYEKITWKKYTCPSQVSSQNGEIVAVGPIVPNPQLYGINSFARNEEFVSELLIKQPLTPQTDGAYVCEGVFLSSRYPFEPVSTIRDIIIIGGKSMYQNCFNRGAIKRSATNQTAPFNN
ncbi:uncharacterized protein LOC135833678 [Planococcus citri]|uniref:uncharacterized protein LOC135833678 n=1 Tax=Planococcus citri TaxID=170843 RepID=UPI0031F7CFCB